MNTVIKLTNIEYTPVTTEILDRINNYKNRIENEGMVGDTYILDGISLFEDTIKELNVDTLNNEVVEYIKDIINQKTNGTGRLISRYISCGINYCLAILEAYNQTLNYKPLTRTKAIINCE